MNTTDSIKKWICIIDSESINTSTANHLGMRTSVPYDLGPGLTDQQLECIYVLMDGNWHERSEIRKKIKNYISPNISGRIILPLEKRGFVEQDEIPVKEGSRKKKKVVRISKDIDRQKFHLLIEYSANDLACKYGSTEKGNLYLKIRDESIKRVEELEKLEKERQKTEEKEYWRQKHKQMDSENWHKLWDVVEIIHDGLKPSCKSCIDKGKVREEDCSILKLPGPAFLIACELMRDIYLKIIQEEKMEG